MQNQISVILPIKVFVIIEKYSQALNNVLMKVQNCIHAINVYDIDSIMRFSTPISSDANILKKIYIGGTLWGEFTYG